MAPKEIKAVIKSLPTNIDQCQTILAQNSKRVSEIPHTNTPQIILKNKKRRKIAKSF